MLAGPPNSHSAKERNRGFGAALSLLSSAHPAIDGLVCYNDLVAVGALRACAGLGLDVPDDVAIKPALAYSLLDSERSRR